MNNIERLIKELAEYDGKPQVIMEVCGTHTAAIAENGIHGMLSDKIRLVSGPGCPVCVTVAAYIDRLTELAMETDTCVVTFGDMMRVCGSGKSLRDAAAEGAGVKMVYSPFDMIRLAKENPSVKYVFAAVGFETTTPIYALIIEQLIKERIKNVRLLTALKTMPQAIRTVAAQNPSITGFLAPGHVSVITGSGLFAELAKELGIPFVTAGFGGEQLISAVYALTRLRGGQSLNMYPSVVSEEGNLEARARVERYFRVCDAAWRGFGVIEGSGLILRDDYMEFDAGSLGLDYDKASDSGCRCGEVIAGKVSPVMCPLFGKVCSPTAPQGACMVSSEGSCYHYFISGRV